MGPVNADIPQSPHGPSSARHRTQQHHALGRWFPIILQTPREDEKVFWRACCGPDTRHSTSDLFHASHAGWPTVQRRAVTQLANTTTDLQSGLQLLALAQMELGVVGGRGWDTYPDNPEIGLSPEKGAC